MIRLAAALVAAAALRYDVTASAGARELAIEAWFPAFSERDGELSVNGGAEPFVRDAVILTAQGEVPLARRSDSWFAPDCAAHGCRIRYRFALHQAAAALGDDDVAALYGNVIESPPGAWLLRPLQLPDSAVVVLNVVRRQGLRFVAGLPRSEIPADTVADLPYAAFGDLRVEAGTLDVAIANTPRRMSDEELLGWIHESAVLIGRYFGRFPVEGALLLVLPASGHQIHGRCRGTGGASILFQLGTEVDVREAGRSWELVHELVHLGFPSLPHQHRWAEEGLATYVEPIARARAGKLTDEKVWGDLVRGLPQGLPQKGDEGLDRTHTWGRTYWGGALFWLLADVEIRERTGNRFGLEHALRAVVAEGGSIARRWPLQRAFEIGDRAVGAKVLEELHAAMGAAPFPVDLAVLFRRLGVAVRGASVEFDDRAPLAHVRRAITARPEPLR